jgi:hypothetical protein
MEEVLASLWPGDCQTCGQSLGSTPPALLVDDLGILTKASLHHRACRAPAWNDSLVITTSSTELLTWRTVVLLLPFDIRGGEMRVAGLLVNPGLEEVWLGRDGDGWRPRLDPGFAAAGLTPPTAGIFIGIHASGLTGRLADGCLSTGIAGRPETYQTWAEAEIRARPTGRRLLAHRDPRCSPGAADSGRAGPGPGFAADLGRLGSAGPRRRAAAVIAACSGTFADLATNARRKSKERTSDRHHRAAPAPVSRLSVQLDDTPDHVPGRPATRRARLASEGDGSASPAV